MSKYNKPFLRDMRLYYNGTPEELKAASESWKGELIKWKDRLTELPDVRKETIVGVDDNGNEIVRHERFDGVVIEEGTPIIADTLGKMDWDIYMLYLNFMNMRDHMNQVLLELTALKGATIGNTPNNIFWANSRQLDEEIILLEGFYDETTGQAYI